MRYHFLHYLAIGYQLQPQNAVRRRVLRAHVEHHLLGRGVSDLLLVALKSFFVSGVGYHLTIKFVIARRNDEATP
jgi:hypothetical protein